MNDSRSYFLSGKRLSSVFNGSAARSLLLVGCIVAVIGTSDVYAHGCADGDTYIGSWVSMAQGGGSYEFSWRLTVPEGEGHVYLQELVARPVGGGAWVTNKAPVRVPAASYFYWCAQLEAAGENLCRLQCWLTTENALYDYAGGWTYTVPLNWLLGDHDEDGMYNLVDPQALIVCEGDIFEAGSCPLPLGADEFLPEDIPIDPPLATPNVGAPYSTGSYSDGYACDGNLAYGGTAIAAYATLTYSNMFTRWADEYWRDFGMFGTPTAPKPYEGAYNMVRGGAGGGVTAYFSACWGKRTSYILTDATSSNAGSKARVGDTYLWHRYVVIGDKWWFQWWTGSCWKSLGVGFDVNTVKGYIVYSNTGLDPRRLVPVGYLPGDVLGETYSNIESGLYKIPGSYNGGMYPAATEQTDLQAVWGSGVSGGSSGGTGGGLTAGELETAFGNALRSAGGLGGGGLSEGIEAIGSGEGATGAAAGVFGMQGVGDGGVSGGIEDGLEGQQAELGTGLTESLGLDAVTPGTDIEGVFDFEFQVPGYGSYTASLSTLPDTSTAWGVVFEGFRLLVRLGISTWWTIVLAFKLIGMYKEIT